MIEHIASLRQPAPSNKRRSIDNTQRRSGRAELFPPRRNREKTMINVSDLKEPISDSSQVLDEADRHGIVRGDRNFKPNRSAAWSADAQLRQ
ncbi:hypothetical protein [Bradyrhizobium manausense]|uniref:hypothetical protein n=1 Tax=Bradyrhizobium manausense TaxID=989370 RepID=UPI0012EDFF6D|nr:hypothetical protein [Bradyrhizobium manausense]